MWNEASLLIQSVVAHSISNLDSSRTRNPSREKRKVAWTETWGETEVEVEVENDNDNDNDDDENARQEYKQQQQQQQQHVTLIQFRPAWFEQLILRMAGIPHTVINSKYAATEATGPLPCLRHGNALVGRHHPPHNPPGNSHHDHHDGHDGHGNTTTTTTTTCTGTGITKTSHILDYLEKYYKYEDFDFDLNLAIPADKKAQSHLIVSLIADNLQPALQVLTFSDQNAWRQLYRRQYNKAGRGSFLGAIFQTWSLRITATKKYQHSLDLDTCQNRVRECYDTLEAILEQNANHNAGGGTGGTTLLGTLQPTTTDALLWAHLADALCNVYIVNILIDYPRMAAFFQSIYQKYFVDFSTITIIGDNPFLHPLEQNRNSFDYTTSIELMQSLRPDLSQLLAASKEIIQSQVRPSSKSRDMLATWRFHGDWFTPFTTNNNNNSTSSTRGDKSAAAAAAETSKDKSQQDVRRQHENNDAIWMSCVVGVTALVLLYGKRVESA